MATKSFEELNTGALTIKNNELPESNTHTLVGNQLVDMVAKEQEIDGKVAQLRSDLSEAIKKETNELKTLIGVPVEPKIILGKLMQGGKIINAVDYVSWGISEKIFIQDSYTSIKVKVKSGWASDIIQFYNDTDVCISFYSTQYVELKEYEIEYNIPQGTSYILIAGYYNCVSSYILYNNIISNIDTLDTLGKNIDTLKENNDDILKIPALTSYGGLLRNGLYVQAVDNDSWKISEKINVSGRTNIRVITTSGWTSDIIAFYDENDGVISFDGTTINDEPREYNKMYSIPEGASYIKIVGYQQNRCLYSFYNGAWSDKTWVAIGDSLTQHNIRATQNYHDFISHETGIKVDNKASSGVGYKNNSFKNQIASITGTPSVITIFGSGNDLWGGIPLGDVNDYSENTLCGFINLTISYLIKHFPLVPYGIITPCPWWYMEPNENTIQPELGVENPMRPYCEKIVEICRLRGVPCLDLYHCSNLHPSSQEFRAIAYTHDDGGGVHPDENGHKLIAPRFREFISSLLEGY